MFTGIVEGTAEVLALQPLGEEGRGRRLLLRLAAALAPPGEDWARPGDSVAVSGACLTLVRAERDARGDLELAFDLSAETLARTCLGALAPGRRVNLERALRLGERLGGHLVSGHVDGSARVVSLEAAGDGGCEMAFELDPGLERYLIEKGSITLDGVSLTVVAPRGRQFRVALIPTTLAATTLGEARPGARVHVEADLVGKWIEGLLAARA